MSILIATWRIIEKNLFESRKFVSRLKIISEWIDEGFPLYIESYVFPYPGKIRLISEAVISFYVTYRQINFHEKLLISTAW